MYKFRAALVGHASDVRAVAAGICPQGSIITCSRDETARIWTPDSDGVGFTTTQTLRGHTRYVVSTCVMPPGDEFPDGLILTGSNDGNIHVYSHKSSEPLFKLTGHTGTVAALAAGKFGTIVSGSWDCSARVWLGQKCVLTLSGHAAAVWAVAILPGSGLVITGSADKTILAWKTGKVIQKFTGHEDCVRGLALLSEEEFLSCGNDATIRRWNINGTCVQTLYGHSNFVYSVAVLPNGVDLVSAGEDRTVRVWRGGQLDQTINLPAQSVWAVACLQNGDIAAGTSDGVCRVFSAAPERQAPPDIQEVYEQEVAGTQLSKAELGGYKVADLPGKEVLLAPGRRDGQTVMVRDGTNVTCHSWSASEQLWKKVGDVVGASGGSTETSGKVLHDGKEYDYVFTVDIQEGAPPLKLPYNTSEDPWQAAQRFIHKHELSQQFLDTVANFIIKNSGGAGAAAKPPQPSGEYYDPFTGAGRYVPAAGEHHVGAGGADPFTGSGRYVPPGTAMDTTPAPAAAPPASRYFPQNDFVYFDKGNVEGMATKLREFNQRTGDGCHRLEETVLQELTKLAEPTASPAPHHLAMLLRLLDWPKELAFPAIDLLRLAVRNPETCQYFCAEERRPALLAALQRFAQPDSPPANQMLALRATCNLFRHASGERAVMAAREDVSAAALALFPAASRAVEVALATLLLNSGRQPQLTDGEAQFRALVGFGTLAAAARDMTALARSLEVESVLERLKNVPEPEKVAACARQLEQLVRSS
ncbi:Phospholipase A-2-activating protein [Amphibalanus amphitrite]|uniref:Phospholipase A-2-activating protein n=1 Tax=Amphibalanus amphitrite TaxID=1232801 RepID=A0A6A4XA23_AMPAM|nr:Phospholipase A-2-activating protein [Amphibalanus amphitrite]